MCGVLLDQSSCSFLIVTHLMYTSDDCHNIHYHYVDVDKYI